MSPFLRHLHACNDAVLPGGRMAFMLGTAPVGWLSSAVATGLAEVSEVEIRPGSAVLHDAARLPAIALGLAERGLFRHRGEAFDVRAKPGGEVLTTIDRGALPGFGIMAKGIHVNGLVRRPDGLHVWVARRAANKALDPGKFDHIVAGGVPAGLTAWGTLIKEAAEEAAIPASLAAASEHVGTISYANARPEGLRRDELYCYDLLLPEDFVPVPADGEVESFALWPAARVLEAVRDSEDFKFNVNLVLIDLFLRHEMIGGAESEELERAIIRTPLE